MHELKAGLYANKFATLWMFPEWFYRKFVLHKNILLKVLSSKSSNFLLASSSFCDVTRKRNNVTVYNYTNHKKCFKYL